MILSAEIASHMYAPNEDAFTSTLGKHLSTLCQNAGYGLSATQLAIIENVGIKSIRYETDSDGNKLFSARIKLCEPENNAGGYSGEDPEEYLKEVSADIRRK